MSNATHVLVIAEAGVNHNGELEMAKRLVDVAAEAGAEAFLKGQRKLVRGHLRSGVRRLRVDRMFLGDWHELRGAIGF